MTRPKDLDPSSNPRALLGAELRHAREKSGFSQEELGCRIFVSGSFIGQLEAGTRRMQPDHARMLDEALGTGGFFARNCKAAAKSKYDEHFAEAAEAEGHATAIRQYAPLLIPGLLQTPAYARAVNRAYDPTTPEETVDEWVDGRMERARLLDHPTKPLLWVVLDESALRRETGGRAVMAEALRHIAGLARRSRAIVQVLPLSAGAHAAAQGALKLMEFEDAPPLVYFEGVRNGRLEDDPAMVDQLRFVFDLLAADALSPEKSLALIEALAQDYTHEEHP
ncbi:helix-turn-helix domain-containing protein [Streptomyces spectabilis]|uniref:Transcriptional regulator with XRE-family HTH domain n=1 Tax=Streptomyces spectabilis TaxID=68270 RepID=A0A5P2XAK2_STRST|nr:helix-turn-helix transcriptional regulator [Streptomyces spectabilis]MBB5106652.1 transcriptional regulator with XRE-family HTH domain [Streptomyces spectabilis]MCI3903491.1 helix-turn-helix transcriptional regulator [Streptomyces spectabilis]QEV60694.1 XRE family transcriptional regulator [Streptomyces spectabilis]GGV48545.1 transcriptional regulator [Streptomyces spectabilis]